MKLTISLLLSFIAVVAANPTLKASARSEAGAQARAVGPPSCPGLGGFSCVGGIDELAECQAQGYGCEGQGPPQLGPGGTPNATCTADCVCTVEVC
ncbi:hypothetical protein FB451DRAFT_1239971 [Mycena latifolia]|nr:hypothetical protein FB451DRAFT_1239971 [Mycena latifolia]